MRNVCYAKPVNGGYQIIGFNVPSYLSPTLPTTCSRSGQPVILLESAHDFINAAMVRADQITDQFITKLKNLWSETTADVNSAREDWDEAANGSDSSETRELVAQYLAYVANSKVLSVLAGESLSDSRQISRCIDSICNKKFGAEIEKAGFEIPVTRQAPGTTLQGLLNMVFGQATLIPGLPQDESGKMTATTQELAGV